MTFRRPESLGAEHDVSTFDCGSRGQTDWLRRHALQAQWSDTARVYVVCRTDAARVSGYYALAAGSIGTDDAPSRVARGVGRYPVPVVILIRLGVDLRDQGLGLGSGLVRDALLQTASVAERVAVRALLIHAEDDRAAAFYRRLSTAFEPSPSNPLHLVLLMKDLRLTIAHAGKSGVSGG